MHQVVTFGEIMMRLAPPGNLRFGQTDTFNATFGGGEANVAVSLAQFGIGAEFVSRLPENDLGRACEAALRGYNVGTRHLLWGGDRLGIYFLEIGAMHRSSKVIYDRSGSAFSTIDAQAIDWKSILQGASLFHWTGITPAVSESAARACADAIQCANEMGIPVSCDLNYRKNLWKYGKKAPQVMPDLVAGCDIIMGNEEDAAMALNIHPAEVDVAAGKLDANAYRDVSMAIMNRFPRCKKVVTTLRASVSANHNQWSAVLWDGNQLLSSSVYQLTHIVDRVGGGDAFMGGLIYGLLTWPDDDASALEFATAASALKHTIPGDFNIVSVDEVMKLMQGDGSGRVSR